MVRNEEKYQQALDLRKRGFTLGEIAKYCDISKSTASKWLKNKAFSTNVTKQNQRRARAENAKRLALMGKARSTMRREQEKNLETQARLEYRHFSSQPLFIAGLMLYAGQRSVKNSRSVRYASAIPENHRIFIQFLLSYGVENKSSIRFSPTLSKGHSEVRCLKKWQGTIGLPLGNFYRTQWLKQSAPAEPLHIGVGNTIIASTVLKSKLDLWLQMARKELRK